MLRGQRAGDQPFHEYKGFSRLAKMGIHDRELAGNLVLAKSSLKRLDCKIGMGWLLHLV